jgi:hypothetical protein
VEPFGGDESSEPTSRDGPGHDDDDASDGASRRRKAERRPAGWSADSIDEGGAEKLVKVQRRRRPQL